MKRYPFASQLTERQRATFAERLLRLRNVLLSIKPSEYKHDSWVRRMGGPNCGTVACAAGHAMARPSEFRGLGIRVVKSGLYGYAFLNSHDELIDDMGDKMDGYFGAGADAHIFQNFAYANKEGILPFPPRNIGRDQVTKRITKFVRETFGYEPT